MNPIRVVYTLFGLGLVVAVILGLYALNQEQTAADKPAENNVAESQDAGEMPQYMQSCLGCHGNDLSGGMGPNLITSTLSKEELVDIIKNGRGMMPPNLAAGNEEAAADYLLSIRK